MLNVTKSSPTLKRTTFLMYMLNIIKLNTAKSHRYSHPRGKYCQHKGECPFARDLMPGNGMWLNETEFIRLYRISRKSFKALAKENQDHPNFKDKNEQRKIRNVNRHLLFFMYYVGTKLMDQEH